ncbi:hypothetical protein KGQ27_03695 [Patescibacteria group bacterium]|nr:hypothetical protein [Patescibacteria group bacterium]MDE1946944.1 hypothetical protein [Patescibacteria group bacterium]MDE2011205.1 hypothetical protein [Patescibacteria group bacterium]MDE2233495.1 hypothetical protein [Patescibacteria group bacterium]
MRLKTIVKGGIVGFGVGALAFIAVLLVTDSSYTCPNIAGTYCPQGLNAVILNVKDSFTYSTMESVDIVLGFVLIPTILGALVGIIFAKMKKPSIAVSVPEAKNKQTENKEREKKALLDSMASGNQPLTNEHARMMLGISEATATRYFDELEKEGKIKQVGKEGAHVFYEKI